MLQKAGIDLSIVSPHCARAVATSKAVKSVPLKTTLKTVGCRRASTFATYYHKPIMKPWTCGQAVLH